MHSCPGPQQFDDFLSGQSDDASAEAIHAHVSQCAECQAKLTSTCLYDTVIFSLKQGKDCLEEISEYELEPELQGAMERLLRLRPTDDGIANNEATVSLSEDAIKASLEQRDSTDFVETPQIEGYEILGVLGRGGMGVVYKARQLGLNRIVALKMILSGKHAGQMDIARFRAEAEAIAHLHHPNIVQIFDIGRAGGDAYFSLEYLNGGSLASLLQGAPQPPLEAAKLVKTLADAMHFAHAKGIVHRDLKPANILLDNELQTSDQLNASEDSKRPSKTLRGTELASKFGIPKVVDFGLAKQLHLESDRTTSGSILGSPSYMAPEQASGQLQKIGPLSDIYSLGAILYEMLVGRPPFRAESVVETLEQVRSQEVLAPRKLLSHIPIDLETICLKCLQKEGSRRYESARDLAMDLQRFISGEPIQARPVSAIERTIRWVRRDPVVAGLGAAVVLIGLIGLIGVVWQWRAAVDSARLANKLAKEADERTKVERWERYRSSMAVVGSVFTQHKIDLTRQALTSTPDEHRGWEWKYFSNQLDRAENILEFRTDDNKYCPVFDVHPRNWQLAMHSPDGSFLSWDPIAGMPFRSNLAHVQAAKNVKYSFDGSKIAVVADDNEIHVLNTVSGEKIFGLVGHQQDVSRLAFSRDGTRLASGGMDGEVRLWDIETGNCSWVRKFPPLCGGLEFIAEGAQLIIAADTELVCVEVESNALAIEYQGHRSRITDLAVSPDGTILGSASAYPENKIRLWETATGKPLAELSGHSNQVSKIAFYVDGLRLASSSLDATLRLWDTKSGECLHVLSGHAAAVNGLAISPDGLRIASCSEDETVRVWDGLTGQPLEVLTGHTAPVPQVAFSQDSRKIISAAFDGTMRIWDSDRIQSACLRGHGRYVYDVTFAGEDRAASVAWDGTLRLWNLATSKQEQLMNHQANVVIAVASDSRGKRLATLSRFADQDSLGRIVTIWDQASGAITQTIPLSRSSWSDSRLAFNPQGDQIAVADIAGPIRLFDANTGNELAQFAGHPGGTIDVAFHPQKAQLASGGMDGIVRLWDLSNRTEIATLEGHKSQIFRIAYSNDGSLIASASSDKTVRLWDSKSKRLVSQMPHGSVVFGLAFSPDNQRLATGCGDKTIRLWDLTMCQEVAELHGHDDYVHAVTFSPDGTRLLSASGDSTIRVWDTRSALSPAK